jgi:hypothetical protein
VTDDPTPGSPADEFDPDVFFERFCSGEPAGSPDWSCTRMHDIATRMAYCRVGH